MLVAFSLLNPLRYEFPRQGFPKSVEQWTHAPKYLPRLLEGREPSFLCNNPNSSGNSFLKILEASLTGAIVKNF